MSVMDRLCVRYKPVIMLELYINMRITNLSARNQTTAIDFRMLLSVSKMLTDLNRCGDEAERIAKMARRIHDSDSGYEPVVELRHMSTPVVSMINRALDAFARQDVVLAAEIVRSDKEVNEG